MGFLEIQLLGSFNLTYDGKLLTSTFSPRLQSLCAYLLLHSDSPQPRRSIAYLFWPESAEKQAMTNLRKLIHDLLAILPDAGSFVLVTRPTLQWQIKSAYRLDVTSFEDAYNQATTTADLKNVVALYHGELLPACYDDWILMERERLFQLYSTTLERLIRKLENEREYRQAISYAYQLIRHDPLQENAYRHLMRLYALRGDLAGVQKTYEACIGILEREMDVSPSELTFEIYRRLVDLLQRKSPPRATFIPAARHRMIVRPIKSMIRHSHLAERN